MSRRRHLKLSPVERRAMYAKADEKHLLRAMSATQFMTPKEIAAQSSRTIPPNDVMPALKRLREKELVLHVPGYGWRLTAAGSARVSLSRPRRSQKPLSG